MADLRFALLLFVISFMYPTFTSCVATPSISFTASNQLKYWSKNVRNNMPANLLSILSPLNKADSDFFASLVSKHSFSSDPKFCNLANLACYSELNSIKPLGLGYGYVEDILVKNIDSFSFFKISTFEEGNKVHLANLDEPFPQRAFLPSQIASKISLVENGLQKIFPQSFVNPNTKGNIEATLRYCNAAVLKGKIKSCLKSLEDMIAFSKRVLGTRQLVALTSEGTKGSEKELIIGKIKKLKANKIVSCHELFLPFATYFCHVLSSTQIYVVNVVESETKVPVNTLLAICHMDTSLWPSNHPAFEILKTTPGNSEACHWMIKMDLLWIRAEENLV